MFHGHLDYFKNHLLKVGLTQNRETMALRTLTTVDLFYSIMCEDLHEYEFIEIAFGSEPGHIQLYTTLEDLCPHYMILEVCWDDLWTLSFVLSQSHGHGSRLVCEVALRRLVWPLNKSQRALTINGHGPWLVCEVALSL